MVTITNEFEFEFVLCNLFALDLLFWKNELESFCEGNELNWSRLILENQTKTKYKRMICQLGLKYRTAEFDHTLNSICKHKMYISVENIVIE